MGLVQQVVFLVYGSGSLSIGQGIVVQHDLLSWLEGWLTHMWAASTAEGITQVTLKNNTSDVNMEITKAIL